MPTTPERVVPPTVQADTLNWMLEQITRLNDLTVDGAEYEQVPGGRQLRVPKTPVGFWARVRKAGGSGSGSDGSGSGVCEPYDWWEQEPLGCGFFQDDEFGRTGTLEDGDPAYSIPHDAIVEEDSIVWLVKGLAIITPEGELSGSGPGDVTEPVIQEWYFQAVGAGGGGAGSGDAGSGESGSGEGCTNMAADFPVRMPEDALPTDRLLTSDPINGTTLNYRLVDLLDAQLLTSTPADRDWPGRLKLDAHSGAITPNADAATVTLDWSATNKHSVTLTASRTMAFANDVDGQATVIIFKSGGTGAFTPVWPAGVKWQGGAAPTLTNASGHWDIVSILRESSGHYIGSTSMNYY